MRYTRRFWKFRSQDGKFTASRSRMWIANAPRLGIRSQRGVRAEGAKPLRTVAIRLRKRQGGLFADGSSVLHFAVLSNIWDWQPVKLIEWHREKAGTIEGVHDVLTDEKVTGVLPSKYFGANAAWLRLAVISYNVLTALKRLALPADLLRARPKRLRFLIFYTAGRLVHHALTVVLETG